MALLSASWTVDTLVFFGTILLAFYVFLTRNFNYWKVRGVPYVKPIPIFGNFYKCMTMKSTIGDFLAHLYNKMDGPFFGIYILDEPVLVVRCPELLKQIMVKDFNYFQDRTILSDEKSDPISSHMLFFSKSPEWKAMRSKMTPIFTSGKMKNMFPLINEVGESLKKYIRKHALNKDFVEAKEVCAKYSTDVITSCAFGIEAGCLESDDAFFREIGRKLFESTTENAFCQTSYFFLPKTAKFLKLPFFPQRAMDFLRDVFWKTIKTREETNFKRNDVIDILIQLRKKDDFVNNIKFENDRVVAQAAQFYAAGFETTSTTIAFALYELCLNKDIQNKLRNEINESIEKYGGITYESVLDNSYLHRCVLETLRKYPVLPFLDRICMQNYQIPGSDVIIEKGTAVYIPMFGLHYDPKYFPQPDVFDPDRFTEEKIKERPQFCYIPFGEGPRNCIGERFGLLGTKLALVHLLTEYEIERCDNTPVPLVLDTKSFFVASKYGLPVKFRTLEK